MEDLSSFLVSSFNWGEIEEMIKHGQPLLPARILSELPITIHNLGGVLRHLNIGCIPMRGSYSLIQPNIEAPSCCSPWTQLREACRSLEVLEMDGPQHYHLSMRLEHISGTKSAYLEGFFVALISTSKLQILRLDFYALGLNNGRSLDREWCPLGSIFQSANWPQIRRLSVVGISMTEEQLHSFFKAIGYEVEHLHLGSLELQSGSWSKAIDLLGEKVGTRYTQGKMKLYLSGVKDEEFSPEKKPEGSPDRASSSLLSDRAREEPVALKLARQ